MVQRRRISRVEGEPVHRRIGLPRRSDQGRRGTPRNARRIAFGRLAGLQVIPNDVYDAEKGAEAEKGAAFLDLLRAASARGVGAEWWASRLAWAPWTSATTSPAAAIAKASESLRNIQWFTVTETRGHVKDGKVAHWQVTIKVGFTLE